MEGAHLLKTALTWQPQTGNSPHVHLMPVGVPGFSRSQDSQVSANGGYRVLWPIPP